MLDLIKDKNLKVVAYVVNKVTGEVLNADEVTLPAEYDATGIQTISDNTNSVSARYNAAGQLITTPQKGLNIIKLSTGKTIKVIVK